MSVAKVGAAKLIPEAELSSDSLFKEVNEIMSDNKLQEDMSAKSKKIGVPDASDRLIKVMVGLVNK